MPGYYIHLATCGGQALKNRSFVLGVEAPDLLKKHIKFCGGMKGARNKYHSLRTDDMPNYSELKLRILQPEIANSNQGLHFGISSNPNVIECWMKLSEEKKSQPFYRGYVWHLLTDAIIYSRLDIDTKFQKVLDEKQSQEDLVNLREIEKKRLHDDWDRTNSLVRDTYPDVTLTKEVEELGVVKFIQDGETTYVDWQILKETIDYLRTLNPLDGNMDFIIHDVLEKIN